MRVAVDARTTSGHAGKEGVIDGVTKCCGLKRLVSVARHDDIRLAIQRETTITHASLPPPHSSDSRPALRARMRSSSRL